jgi:hypothetical protein
MTLNHFSDYEAEYPEGTVPCTRCGFRPAPAGDTIEVDPLCDICTKAMAKLQREFQDLLCKGWGEDCGNLIDDGSDLCPDCSIARLDAQSPRIPR